MKKTLVLFLLAPYLFTACSENSGDAPDLVIQKILVNGEPDDNDKPLQVGDTVDVYLELRAVGDLPLTSFTTKVNYKEGFDESLKKGFETTLLDYPKGSLPEEDKENSSEYSLLFADGVMTAHVKTRTILKSPAKSSFKLLFFLTVKKTCSTKEKEFDVAL